MLDEHAASSDEEGMSFGRRLLLSIDQEDLDDDLEVQSPDGEPIGADQTAWALPRNAPPPPPLAMQAQLPDSAAERERSRTPRGQEAAGSSSSSQWQEAVKRDWRELRRAPLDVRNNPEVVGNAMRCSGGAALAFSPELRDDSEFVFGASQEIGPQVFQHASEDLRNDRELVLQAVQQLGAEVLVHISPSLQSDRAFMTEAVEYCPPAEALHCIPEEMRLHLLSDADFVYDMVKEIGAEVLEAVPEVLCDDKTFMSRLTDLCSPGEILEFASERLRRELLADDGFMTDAVRRAGPEILEELKELPVDIQPQQDAMDTKTDGTPVGVKKNSRSNGAAALSKETVPIGAPVRPKLEPPAVPIGAPVRVPKPAEAVAPIGAAVRPKPPAKPQPPSCPPPQELLLQSRREDGASPAEEGSRPAPLQAKVKPAVPVARGVQAAGSPPTPPVAAIGGPLPSKAPPKPAPASDRAKPLPKSIMTTLHPKGASPAAPLAGVHSAGVLGAATPNGQKQLPRKSPEVVELSSDDEPGDGPIPENHSLLQAVRAAGAQVLEHASHKLRGSREFMLAAAACCANPGDALPYATRKLRKRLFHDKEVMINADKDLMLLAAREFGAKVLAAAPPELLADFGFMLQVSAMCGKDALAYTSPELRAELDE